MEPDETSMTDEPQPQGTRLNKQSHAIFIRTWTDEHLILHLTHKVGIWFKDEDILAFEELVRRYRATWVIPQTTDD